MNTTDFLNSDIGINTIDERGYYINVDGVYYINKEGKVTNGIVGNEIERKKYFWNTKKQAELFIRKLIKKLNKKITDKTKFEEFFKEMGINVQVNQVTEFDKLMLEDDKKYRGYDPSIKRPEGIEWKLCVGQTIFYFDKDEKYLANECDDMGYVEMRNN